MLHTPCNVLRLTMHITEKTHMAETYWIPDASKVDFKTGKVTLHVHDRANLARTNTFSYGFSDPSEGAIFAELLSNHGDPKEVVLYEGNDGSEELSAAFHQITAEPSPEKRNIQVGQITRSWAPKSRIARVVLHSRGMGQFRIEFKPGAASGYLLFLSISHVYIRDGLVLSSNVFPENELTRTDVNSMTLETSTAGRPIILEIKDGELIRFELTA